MELWQWAVVAYLVMGWTILLVRMMPGMDKASHAYSLAVVLLWPLVVAGAVTGLCIALMQLAAAAVRGFTRGLRRED